MKKTYKLLLSLLIVIVMLVTTALPVLAEDNPYGNIEDLQKLNEEMMKNSPAAGALDMMDGMTTFMSIFFPLVLGLVIFIWVFMILSIRKAKELDQIMETISVSPTQENAEIALDKFSSIGGLRRFAISSGSDTRGVHFSMWRDIFNRVIVPSANIKTATKEALRQAMIRLNTRDLKPVQHIQSQAEADAEKHNFGAGGELNVWHNLKSLMGCDLYRDVKIYNSNTDSQIDAVVVDANKGIFLLEVKSNGGSKNADANRVITYHGLDSDPSNQIYRHEADFVTCFTGLNLQDKIKNLLVFSWPSSAARRTVDMSTFPETDYEIITVEQLLTYFKRQPANPLSEEERHQIATTLRSYSAESIIR